MTAVVGTAVVSEETILIDLEEEVTSSLWTSMKFWLTVSFLLLVFAYYMTALKGAPHF